MLFPEVLQRDDELLVGPVEQPVLLVLDGGDELAELLQGVGNHHLVVGLVVPDAFELEVDQGLGQPPLAI